MWWVVSVWNDSHLFLVINLHTKQSKYMCWHGGETILLWVLFVGSVCCTFCADNMIYQYNYVDLHFVLLMYMNVRENSGHALHDRVNVFCPPPPLSNLLHCWRWWALLIRRIAGFRGRIYTSMCQSVWWSLKGSLGFFSSLSWKSWHMLRWLSFYSSLSRRGIHLAGVKYMYGLSFKMLWTDPLQHPTSELFHG